jgi:hypothetical protein
MKNLVFASLVFLMTALALSAQTGPIMKFDSDEVNYGEITQNADPLKVWTFTNVGDEPLIIKNAKGSCGCTVPSWPKEPIMPGESAAIEIRYDTKRLGSINKVVTLTTNEKSEENRRIKVKGKVNPPAVEEILPTNEGRMF